MGASSFAFIPLFLYVVIFLKLHAIEARVPNPTQTKPKPLMFPLKTQKLTTSLPLPSTPNKLRFHHNITLTVSLTVGTPPQNVTLVLDTGSELSWLLCNPKSFNPLASKTYNTIPCSSPTCKAKTQDLPSPATCEGALCHVSLTYADGSSSEGTLSTDVLHVGARSTNPIRTTFGCMAHASTSAPDDVAATGMLGMNRGALSFVTQTATRRFSYCISDRDSAGVLLIGHAANIVPLNYTPLVQISLPLPYFDRVAYSVQLEGIRVGKNVLPIPKSSLVPDHTGAGQTMVDSGTQFTFLMGDAYNALKTEFLRQTKGVLKPLNEPDFVFQGAMDQCFLLPAWQVVVPKGLPDVVIMLSGAEVKVAGERLLYKVGNEKRGSDVVWCLTFGNSELVPMEMYVIGHHHQQNVWVEYDLENRRVGFAPVRCDLASQRLGLLL